MDYGPGERMDEIIATSPREVPALGERPPSSALSLSIAIHVVAIVAILFAARVQRSVQVALENTQVTQVYSGGAAKREAGPVYYAKSTPGQGLSFPTRVRARRAKTRVNDSNGTSDSPAIQQLRAEAGQRTSAITNTLRIRGIYGFAPGADYQLARQTGGDIPKITPAELPPHYEQFVQIEVTIDIAGRVADARIISGIVDETIQHKLLAAIRDFKYVPATRNGSPIPSQRDIIIRVPS